MFPDFDQLLNLPLAREFSPRVIYERPGQPAFAVRGKFDREALRAEFGEAGASTGRVHLGMMLADFPAGFMPMQGDRVQVAHVGTRQEHADGILPAGATTQTFDVADVERDGEGHAVLVLTGRVGDDP